MDKLKQIAKAAWSWIGADGVQHFCVCAIIVFLFGWISPLWIAPVVAFSFGLAKEVWDLSNAGWNPAAFDWKHSGHDLACDFAGVVFGLLVCLFYLTIR